MMATVKMRKMPKLRQQSVKTRKTNTKAAKQLKQTKADELENHALFQIIEVFKLPRPVREFCLNGLKGTRFDFAWPGHKLLLEVNGGLFSQGRHNRGLGYRKDLKKYNDAVAKGFRLITVETISVKEDEAYLQIKQIMSETSMYKTIDQIPPDALAIARETVKKHEGLRLEPYCCTAGKLTVGYGRNLDDVGLSAEEHALMKDTSKISLSLAELMLDNDLERAFFDAASLVHEFYSDDEQRRINPARQAALANMALNLGRTRLSLFRKMLSALYQRDYARAAKEMLDSKWAKQVGHRAKELAQIMKTGAYGA